ncbi:hypothetical protein NL676_007039 [Syzygium grande]|nr:hypothetical protein NL676_007039 [Syzygium grande]
MPGRHLISDAMNGLTRFPSPLLHYPTNHAQGNGLKVVGIVRGPCIVPHRCARVSFVAVLGPASCPCIVHGRASPRASCPWIVHGRASRPCIVPVHRSWPSIAPVHRARASFMAEHRARASFVAVLAVPMHRSWPAEPMHRPSPRASCPWIVHGRASRPCIVRGRARARIVPMHRSWPRVAPCIVLVDRSWPRVAPVHRAHGSFMAEHGARASFVHGRGSRPHRAHGSFRPSTAPDRSFMAEGRARASGPWIVHGRASRPCIVAECIGHARGSCPSASVMH